jgi:CHAD domain-containing protein
MTGCKDHINVSTTNIIKTTLEALPADNQQHFDDSMRQEEEELLRQLVEQREKAKEKYLSYFMLDSHRKIIHQWEIDMKSLIPSPQAPNVSIPDQSFKDFRIAGIS